MDGQGGWGSAGGAGSVCAPERFRAEAVQKWRWSIQKKKKPAREEDGGLDLKYSMGGGDAVFSLACLGGGRQLTIGFLRIRLLFDQTKNCSAVLQLCIAQ